LKETFPIDNILSFFILFIAPAVVFAGALYWQIRLSKREKLWPGLMPPLVFFLLSFPATYAMAMFSEPPNGLWAELLYWFPLCNIPTALLLLVFAVCSLWGQRKLHGGKSIDG